MGCTACTESQCLYKGELYLFYTENTLLLGAVFSRQMCQECIHDYLILGGEKIHFGDAFTATFSGVGIIINFSPADTQCILIFFSEDF